MKIVLFIGSLKTGGAERQMATLASGMAHKGHTVVLVTMYPDGDYGSLLRGQPNLEVHSLYPQRTHSFPLRVLQLFHAPLKLRKSLRSIQPDAIYSMLEFSNLFAWIATRGRMKSRLVWGHRSSNMEFGWKMGLAEKVCAALSFSVPLMIANSTAGMEFAKGSGYCSRNFSVVPNGINTDFFQCDPDGAHDFRQELRIAPDAPLVGLVARLDPMKDHPTFLEAAALVRQQAPACRFVIVGDGPSSYRQELMEYAQRLQLQDALSWAGNRTDMPAVYSSLNVLSSSSYGEGFSNVIAEAMACETRCVVTDVGDSRLIVGETGLVVPPKDPQALAHAIVQALDMGRCPDCRNRIETLFSVDAMVGKTVSLLEEHVIARPG